MNIFKTSLHMALAATIVTGSLIPYQARAKTLAQISAEQLKASQSSDIDNLKTSELADFLASIGSDCVKLQAFKGGLLARLKSEREKLDALLLEAQQSPKNIEALGKQAMSTLLLLAATDMGLTLALNKSIGETAQKIKDLKLKLASQNEAERLAAQNAHSHYVQEIKTSVSEAAAHTQKEIKRLAEVNKMRGQTIAAAQPVTIALVIATLLSFYVQGSSASSTSTALSLDLDVLFQNISLLQLMSKDLEARLSSPACEEKPVVAIEPAPVAVEPVAEPVVVAPPVAVEDVSGSVEVPSLDPVIPDPVNETLVYATVPQAEPALEREESVKPGTPIECGKKKGKVCGKKK